MITIEWLRSFRIEGYAIFDLAVSFLGVYLIAPLLTKLFRKVRLEIPRNSWIYLTLPLSVPIHLAFGQMTLMTQNVLDLNGHYAIKILLPVLTVLGGRGIKVIRK